MFDFPIPQIIRPEQISNQALTRTGCPMFYFFCATRNGIAFEGAYCERHQSFLISAVDEAPLVRDCPMPITSCAHATELLSSICWYAGMLKRACATGDEARIERVQRRAARAAERLHERHEPIPNGGLTH